MKQFKPPKTRKRGRHAPIMRARQSSHELRGPQHNKHGQIEQESLVRNFIERQRTASELLKALLDEIPPKSR